MYNTAHFLHFIIFRALDCLPPKPVLVCTGAGRRVVGVFLCVRNAYVGVINQNKQSNANKSTIRLHFINMYLVYGFIIISSGMAI